MAELDYYKVLDIPSSAGASLIKKQYQQLAKQHHPDHRGDEKSMVIINRAYEVLSNSSKRIEYDRLRNLNYARQTTVKTTGQHTYAYKASTSRQTKTTNRDKITVALFITLLLFALFGMG